LRTAVPRPLPLHPPSHWRIIPRRRHQNYTLRPALSKCVTNPSPRMRGNHPQHQQTMQRWKRRIQPQTIRHVHPVQTALHLRGLKPAPPRHPLPHRNLSPHHPHSESP
jgi:hypothetical protein